MSKNVMVILGSMRAQSNTAKVAALTAERLRAAGFSVDLLDPRQTDLAFPGLEHHDAFATTIKERVRQVDGAVLITPEYDGSISSILKLVIEHFGYPSDLAGKPVSLIGCAGGRIGAVKAIEHLRSMLSHTGALVLPLSHSIASVHQAFDAEERCIDATVDQGIKNVVEELATFLNSGIPSA